MHASVRRLVPSTPSLPLVASTALWLIVGSAVPAQEREREPAKLRNVSGGPLRPDQACYDVQHYTLTLTLDPATKTIAGTLAMRALWVGDAPRLVLDLDPALEVGKVTLDGAPVPNERDGGRIVVKPEPAMPSGREFTIEVEYRGAPHVARRPPWDGGFTWGQTKDGKPWIATSCQGEGADLWWPCKDHPSDKPNGFDLHCTVPKGLVVASNGVQQGEPKVAGDHATYHWRTTSPISNYNVALNIAPYVLLSDTYTCVDGTKMPFLMYVLPESVEKAKRCQKQFQDHLHVFEELLGPYPFRGEKYGIAETPHLGMEHQTIIAYGNGFRDEQYDWLHNHELAHEWWANLVTCRDWKDMWLHEGFGTYMQPLYREARFGRKAYDDEIRKYRLMNRTAMAPRESKDSHEIYFGANGNDIYYKGSYVLHTLRWQLGDPPFFELLRRFCYPTEAAAKATDGSQVRFVDTDELVTLCSRIAKTDMKWFFEVYVRQPSLPQLLHERVDGKLRLSWRVAGDLPFELAVPVEVDGQETRVAMPGGVGELPMADPDSTFRIDPQQRLLMQKPKSIDGR